jgi:hypothetical protein
VDIKRTETELTQCGCKQVSNGNTEMPAHHHQDSSFTTKSTNPNAFSHAGFVRTTLHN